MENLPTFIQQTDTMEKQFAYVTKLDIKFDHLQRMDIPQMIREWRDKWFNQTLTQVNDSVVRLGIVEGEYHWHKHDHDDEFFFVLEGQLLIDLEDQQNNSKFTMKEKNKVRPFGSFNYL